jgi:hypothetical protein
MERCPVCKAVKAPFSSTPPTLQKKRCIPVKNSTAAIVIFLVGIIITGGAGGYELRPIADYQLTGPDTISVFPNDNRTNVQFQFYADNSGKTDITLNVTVAAINATVSNDGTTFASSASNLMLLKAGTASWGLIFYLKPDQKSSFVVYVSGVQVFTSRPTSGISDVISSLIVQFKEFHAINRQSLPYVRDFSQNPIVYKLK